MVFIDYCHAFVSLSPLRLLGSVLLTHTSFPMYLPVNLENLGNMNWSIVVIGAIIVLPGIYWVTHARHVYIKEGESALDSDAAVVEGVSQSPTITSIEPKH
jgi:choline transport protein